VATVGALRPAPPPRLEARRRNAMPRPGAEGWFCRVGQLPGKMVENAKAPPMSDGYVSRVSMPRTGETPGASPWPPLTYPAGGLPGSSCLPPVVSSPFPMRGYAG
jgi:hypothetical protein